MKNPELQEARKQHTAMIESAEAALGEVFDVWLCPAYRMQCTTKLHGQEAKREKPSGLRRLAIR